MCWVVVGVRGRKCPTSSQGAIGIEGTIINATVGIEMVSATASLDLVHVMVTIKVSRALKSSDAWHSGVRTEPKPSRSRRQPWKGKGRVAVQLNMCD